MCMTYPRGQLKIESERNANVLGRRKTFRAYLHAYIGHKNLRAYPPCVRSVRTFRAYLRTEIRPAFPWKWIFL